MPKAKEGNIYDLVERAAARRQVPRLELWEIVLRALIEGKLPPLNLSISERPDHFGAPATTYGGWFSDILRAVVTRRFDPNIVAHIFRQILVSRSDFESLLRRGNIGGRGPKPGETGLQKADRKLFREIKRRIESGQAQSPHGAALQLALNGKLAGAGSPENRAKRVSALYRRERPENR